MRYYSKPEFVDAVQWTGDNADEIGVFCKGSSVCSYNYSILAIGDDLYSVRAKLGDYITRGMAGQFKVISRAAFERKYDTGEDSK